MSWTVNNHVICGSLSKASMPEHQHSCQHDHGLGIVNENIEISVTSKRGSTTENDYETAKNKNKKKVSKPQSWVEFRD